MSQPKQKGFTIVELLIVMVVIAILAAVITSAFSGVQRQARVAALKSDLSAAYRHMTYAYTAEGIFPTEAEALPAGEGTNYELSVNGTASPPTFCITGTKAGISYMITSGSSEATEGVCEGHVGGIAVPSAPTITNLILNPSFELDTTGWHASRATRAIVTGAGQEGGDILRVTVNSVGWFPRTYIGSGYEAAVESGKTYRFSAWIKSSLPTVISLDPVGGSGASSSQTFTTNNQWTYVSLTIGITDPADTGLSAWIGFPNNTALNETLDIDSVMLTEGETQYNYADGDSSGWSWNGTAHASPSSGPAL